MKIALAMIFLAGPISSAALAQEATPQDKRLYREMAFRIRTNASFKVAGPVQQGFHFNYSLAFGEPKWTEPVIWDFPTSGDEANADGNFIRHFWEKIYLKEGSVLRIGEESIPLTCIHVEGRDNRRAGLKSPQFPDFTMQIIFVAHDASCTGPVNPDWPGGNGRKEAWKTTVHYNVVDVATMLPLEAGLRYRWSEFEADLQD